MQALRDNQITEDENRLTLVQSYIAWWNMAGFDQAVESQTINWLTKKTPKADLKNESTQNIRDSSKIIDRNANLGKKVNIRARAITAASSIITQDNWPKTLSEIKDAIVNGVPLPGNIYSQWHVGPHYLNISQQKIPQNEISQNQKTIMLISDFPNAHDLDEKSLLSRKEKQLIVKMMTAAGLQKYNIYCASLASTHPIYDELPNQDLPLIHAFINHHIEVLDPVIIISLGSAVCNALLNAELMKSRRNLHYFNLNSKQKTLLTTFHPKTLLANPYLKEKAWEDLQLLMKKDIL